jgi:hypothetical protein
MTALEVHGSVESARPPNIVRPIGVGRVEAAVAIVDPAEQTKHIEAFLPRRWATCRYDNIYEVDQPDLLVLGSATPYLVAAARLLHPQTTIVALIEASTPPRMLVDLLHSGANACVREGALPILAAHLIAGHRRRSRRAFMTRRRVA